MRPTRALTARRSPPPSPWRWSRARSSSSPATTCTTWKLLLEQTEGTGVSIYTHGEMLPAHAYPELKKYPQLKGNFGTAWQNQKKEFDGVPAAFLFTTNCLMPPKESYADNVFTTEVVAFPRLHAYRPRQGLRPGYPEGAGAGRRRAPHDSRHQRRHDDDHGLRPGHGALRGRHGGGRGEERRHQHFFLVAGCDGARAATTTPSS